MATKRKSLFPDPRSSDDYGIVGFGGDLESETLLDAYQNGIFPWPSNDEDPIPWFSPKKRFVLEFSRLKIPKNLAKLKSKTESIYRFSIDEDFKNVITKCQKTKRPSQRGTWITRSMRDAYLEFHKLGHAHSVEVWEEKDLVGGLYGVDPGGAFAGESMFHERDGASLLALLFLIEHLKKRGATWLDAQTHSAHLERMGAREIPQEEFLALLQTALTKKKKLF